MVRPEAHAHPVARRRLRGGLQSRVKSTDPPTDCKPVGASINMHGKNVQQGSGSKTKQL